MERWNGKGLSVLKIDEGDSSVDQREVRFNAYV